MPGKLAELVFDLLPISYLFRRGNCVRVAVAGADCDHFALVPSSPPQLTMSYGGPRPSRIDLPVVR